MGIMPSCVEVYVHHADSERNRYKSPQRPQNSTPTLGSSDVVTVNEMSDCVSTKACLETLLVKVWGPKGSKVVRAVINSESSQSYILGHIVKDLGVPIMREEELDHQIFGGIRYTDRYRIYCLTLSSIGNNRCVSCPASATNQIARSIRKPTFCSWALELASKEIQLSAFKAESDVIELLLGADINPKIATANMLRLSDDLIARETLLGSVVQNKMEGKSREKILTRFITGGWSPNDYLAKGPNLLELIPDIMLRFRFNKIGVVADIEKAFLQISVAKEVRQFLRFLWWEDGKQENLRIYQHKRVVFGATSSPFLLAATLKLHLEQYENEREVIPLLKLKSELKWDQLVPEDIAKKFVEWQSQIPELLSVRIPRLTKQVMKIISESIAIPETNIWFWTDSSTALCWNQNEKPWETFVRNRVNEICSISKKENLHHMSGVNNPADLPSRGSSVKKFIEHKWWKEPSFLWGEEAS
ncbi:hypothetical protein LAZ67_1007132 [Cordylochernes scorpioides]|uniref:Reverse transcriptase domain-containing protein n=1 Tax=Cordylochernes scorpioides TaxID=51811 RepID=A0ABY6K090_9ARAC|nr:hypothetical protein LAZ67_1007132 [Cordylochernes scorpioides]